MNYKQKWWSGAISGQNLKTNGHKKVSDWGIGCEQQSPQWGYKMR